MWCPTKCVRSVAINDIGALNLNCLPNLFADDTALFYNDVDISANRSNPQNDLNKLAH